MSINTQNTFKFVGIGNNFTCYLNDTQYGVGNPFNSSLAGYNSDGVIAVLSNHDFGLVAVNSATTPTFLYWISIKNLMISKDF